MSGAGQAEAKWLLQFTNPDEYDAEDGNGRPWGDGTAMAERAKVGQNPWDDGCRVTPVIGGDAAMIAIRKELEQAIAIAEALGKVKEGGKEKFPAGERGHVYITGLQLNALRDLSSTNPWGSGPWKKGEKATVDQTALGLVVRMMSAGITVRILLWMPNVFEEEHGVKDLSIEHRCIAAAVQEHNVTLEKIWKRKQQPIGVVALDVRAATPVAASLHQKMIAIRVGNDAAPTIGEVNVAFCGGVDLAFIRRDFGLAGTKFVGDGDWQSGKLIPSADSWPQQSTPPLGGYPKYPLEANDYSDFKTELPANVYGPTNQHWHDHHLKLEGPIVATLEQQFVERWAMYASVGVVTYDRTKWEGIINKVCVTSSACVGADGKTLVPLPPAKPVDEVGTTTVQMWRTIPLRSQLSDQPPFERGEFTVMAGISNAVLKSSKLITICDQYFWSLPLARLLAYQLKKEAGLKLVIFLPPYGTTQAPSELALRYAALKTLWNELGEAKNRERVMVRDMWSAVTTPKEPKGRGVYVHAKSQTYDDQLFVCGSANMNRRSLQCDAELDCAVLGEEGVNAHLGGLYECLTGSPWPGATGNWLETFWEGIDDDTAGTLVPDPFYAEAVNNPKTPNGVSMQPKLEYPYGIFEPSSIDPKVDESVCTTCAEDPGAKGRLDEITFLLERCFKNGTWPYRVVDDQLCPEENEDEECKITATDLRLTL
jgi:phosphatidylserine/phosphatidylglycerophosphate/cardiolipin synthase-like enzyme